MKRYIAQVFMRSVSGRSLKELAGEQLPENLAPFLPHPSAEIAVRRYFESAGFTVHCDELTHTISIEAPADLYSRVFGLRASKLEKFTANDSVSLDIPAGVAEFIDSIILTPKPEMF